MKEAYERAVATASVARELRIYLDGAAVGAVLAAAMAPGRGDHISGSTKAKDRHGRRLHAGSGSVVPTRG